MATGAGRPTVIDMKNNLIRGIRKASDFLMALQLTGAFKRDALPNLQMRVPAVVIGGGLTAIDTATELMAYYPLQVEKTLQQYDVLAAEIGEARVRTVFDTEELELLDEYLAHGRAVRTERARAEAAREAPNFVPLVRAWGGVTIAYRKRMVDSPAYRLNHEEVIKALEEGIAFAENLNPIEAVPDGRGAVKAMVFKREGHEARDGRDATETLPARTVLVAAGTTPNITYEKEIAGTFQLDAKKKFFQPHAVSRHGDGRFHLSPDANGFFTSYDVDGRFVSYYGDNHPRYAGNVVKAMASAKDGFPHVVRLFATELSSLDASTQSARDAAWAALVRRLDADFGASRRRRGAAHADHRRSDRQGASRRAALPPGPVLPAAELRVDRRARGRDPAADGGHRADRRLGRQGQGTVVADRARARRVEPARGVFEEGRARRRDGTDRRADRDSGTSKCAAARRGSGQRRAVLDRQGDARSRQHGDLFRRLQER